MSGVFLAAAVSCGCAAHRPAVVDERANNSIVRVARGSSLDVVLHSSYWSVRGSSRPSVLAPDGRPRLLPGSCPPGVGCATLELAFTARRQGTAVVTATRVSCGEALLCSPGQRSYRLTVVVYARPGTGRSSAA